MTFDVIQNDYDYYFHDIFSYIFSLFPFKYMGFIIYLLSIIRFLILKGIIGHSAFSETRVFLGSLTTALGPVLRVYEFDRYNSTLWQVDILLLNDTLFVHPVVTNPTDVDLNGYWWTCVG